MDPVPERPRNIHRGLPASTRARLLRYLLLAWHPSAIADECGVSLSTIYQVEQNLIRYGGVGRPLYRKLGRPSKLTEADAKALLQWLLHEG